MGYNPKKVHSHRFGSPAMSSADIKGRLICIQNQDRDSDTTNPTDVVTMGYY